MVEAHVGKLLAFVVRCELIFLEASFPGPGRFSKKHVDNPQIPA